MLKNCCHIDEIAECHKLNKKKQDSVLKKKIEDEKTINPKYVFEKCPKSSVNQKKTKYRKPKSEKNNLKPLME
jgi:hypothetical protein